MTSAGRSLEGRVVLVTGGVRGVGRLVVTELGRRGARLGLLAGDGDVAREVVAGVVRDGGEAVVLPVDVRDARGLEDAVATVVERWGGVDACLNCAGVAWLAGTSEVGVEGFDLLHETNVRSAFVATRACLPHLRRSPSAHVLSIAPPLNLGPRWLGGHPAYTSSKYALTLLALGWADELAADRIASNALWPERVVSAGPEAGTERARHAQCLADAVAAVLVQDPGSVSGRMLLDVEVLRAIGVGDLAAYGGARAPLELFVDGPFPPAGGRGDPVRDLAPLGEVETWVRPAGTGPVGADFGHGSAEARQG